MIITQLKYHQTQQQLTSMKLKICSICERETVLWKSSPKLCKNCWLKIKASEPSKSKSCTLIPKSTKSLAYRIKSVSDKKLAELKEYRVVRDRYLKNNPICEYNGCSSTEITLHHKRGRVGSLLTDDKYFCSLCIKHHEWAEKNPKDAKSMGLSQNRLDK